MKYVLTFVLSVLFTLTVCYCPYFADTFEDLTGLTVNRTVHVTIEVVPAPQEPEVCDNCICGDDCVCHDGFRCNPNCVCSGKPPFDAERPPRQGCCGKICCPKLPLPADDGPSGTL